MPASTLTRYKTQANKIMKDIRLLKNKDVAIMLNVSPQVVTYRIKTFYPKEFPNIIRLLNMAGYEIRKIEEEEEV